ncbi:hypothetical protein CR513_61779, partial [Mucuna pruriens]
MYLAHKATTHMILMNNKFFSSLLMQEVDVSTISRTTNIIEGSKKANILLHGGTKLHIDNALYYSKSHINLLSFKDICLNAYHIETKNEGSIEYLYIMKLKLNKKYILKKLLTFPMIYTNRSLQIKVNMLFGMTNWSREILQPNNFSCIACSQQKLIIRPSLEKMEMNLSIFRMDTM